MELKTILITQARTGSTRLPGKVLKTINGKTLLQIHLDRLKNCKTISDIIVATTVNEADEQIFKSAIQWGYKSYRGSEQDVLDRYYQAAKPFNPQWVVRVTSDCPLLDPVLVDEVVSFTQRHNVDYGTNVIKELFPDGQDVEVFTFASLEKAWKDTTETFNREHVTPYIRNNSNLLGGNIFTSINYPCEQDFSKIRMTVDEPRDFELIERLVNDLGTNKTWREYTLHIINNSLGVLNQGIVRNEALIKYLNSKR
jgi:spore coat polysaccharide biosynthesis protein SpsF (cytidylyltransferase family)